MSAEIPDTRTREACACARARRRCRVAHEPAGRTCAHPGAARRCSVASDALDGATRRALAAERERLRAELDEAYWRFYFQARGKPPVCACPAKEARYAELGRLLRADGEARAMRAEGSR